jgi:hypothetical protein
MRRLVHSSPTEQSGRTTEAKFKERDIGERDIGESNIRERDIRERAIGETVATCRFSEQLLLHIDSRGVSGYLSFLQSWRH